MGKTAFDGQRQNVFMLAPESLVLITDETNPMYDPRVKMPLKPDFIASIEEHGVMVPIVVRKEGDQAVVVFGRQRTRAAIEVNKKRVKAGLEPMTVPVYQRKGGDADLYECSLAENWQRMAANPMADAEKMAKLVNGGRSVEQIARQAGVSVATVRNRLDLLELSPVVRKLVSCGDLSPTAAVKLSGLDSDAQCKQAKTLVEKGGTVNDALDSVREAKKTRRAKAPSSVAPIRRRKEIEEQAKAFEAMSERKRGTIDPLNVIRWVLGEEVTF